MKSVVFWKGMRKIKIYVGGIDLLLRKQRNNANMVHFPAKNWVCRMNDICVKY